MRELTTIYSISEFMKALGRVARSSSRVYFTGGTSAVLLKWREATVDIDLRFDPELDELYRAIPGLKERLKVNVELASPSDFIPELPNWKDRSIFINREGNVDFYHYDFYSQALSKIERGHKKDLDDIDAMFQRNLIERDKLRELFEAIEPMLYRYPAIDADTFARAVSDFLENE